MNVNGTKIKYYELCKRKLWLFSNGIWMEHTSDAVAEGKLIGDTAYADRAEKNTQLAIDGVVIDFYDAKTRTVHETKKSDKTPDSDVAQVQFYLWVLYKNGITDAQGVIEYPTMRTKTLVPPLTAADIAELERKVADIEQIIAADKCPAVIDKPICKKCSYFEFCYADEV